MFKSVQIENFGIFDHLNWQEHGQINVLIGETDTGKTYLLKLLYCLAKSLEDYSKRQQSDRPSWQEVLAEKLFWVYQPDDRKLGALVKKGEKRLNVEAKIFETRLSFSLNQDATRKISQVVDIHLPPQEMNVLFIPPEEILTAMDAIAATRDQLKIFGFDDTYQDLIHALRVPLSQQDLPKSLQSILQDLETLVNGEISREDHKFILRRGEETFAMSQTAEGIKKLGIFTTLIQNRTLKQQTILILDEPEVNLHRQALRAFTKLLFNLAQADIQIYLATHSYVVVKQLEILARKHQYRIPICSLTKGIRNQQIISQFGDLQAGMPDNPIIDASIDLYEEEVRLELES